MSTPALASDYLFLAPLIAARVAEQVSGLAVEGAEDLAQVVDAQDQRSAVCYVMWAGDRFADATPSDAAQQVYQQWVLWLRVLNTSAADKRARAAAAGATLSALHRALAAWKPAGLARGFKRVAGPRPNYAKVSGLYPLAFEIQLHL